MHSVRNTTRLAQRTSLHDNLSRYDACELLSVLAVNPSVRCKETFLGFLCAVVVHKLKFSSE
jgi:hypothetical protein